MRRSLKKCSPVNQIEIFKTTENRASLDSRASDLESSENQARQTQKKKTEEGQRSKEEEARVVGPYQEPTFGSCPTQHVEDFTIARSPAIVNRQVGEKSGH